MSKKLTLIAALGLIALLGSLRAGPVLAQPVQITATQQLTIAISSDLSSTVDLKIIATNTTGALLDSFTVLVPFIGLHGPAVYVNGTMYPPSLRAQDNATELAVTLGSNAVYPGQQAVVELIFTLPRLLQQQFGLTHLYIPGFDSSLQVTSTQVQINYPATLGTLRYCSGTCTQGQNQVSADGAAGLWLVWGDQVKFGLQEQVGISSGNSLMSLVNDSAGQTISYEQFTPSGPSYIDTLANIWTSASTTAQPVSYKALVQLEPPAATNEFTGIERNLFTGQLPDLSTYTTQPLQAQALFNWLLNKYDISADLTLSSQNPSEVYNQPQLSSWQFSLLYAAMAANAGLPCRVSYGYLLMPTSLSTWEQNPHTWAECVLDGQLIVADPFWQESTGFLGFNMGSLNRIRFGNWTHSADYDNMLGLIGNTPRPRPQLLETTQIPAKRTDLSWELQLDNPTNGFSGENYPLNLTITNPSGHFLSVRQLLIAGNSEIARLQLSNSLMMLVAPVNQTSWGFALREYNFLYDGQLQALVDLDFEPDYAQDLQGIYTIRLQPDSRIFIGVFIAAISGVVLVILWMIRLQILRRRRLRDYNQFAPSVS